MELLIIGHTGAKTSLKPLSELSQFEKIELEPGRRFQIPKYSIESNHVVIQIYCYSGFFNLDRDENGLVCIDADMTTIAKFGTQQSSSLNEKAYIKYPAGTLIKAPRVWHEKGHYRFPVFIWADHCKIGDDNPVTTEDHVNLIVAECLRQEVTNPAQIAYVLATAEHESRMGQLMVEIASGRAYEPPSRLSKILGNIYQGDGAKFKGRGYVQITGRNNYSKYSRLTGHDLIRNPQLASSPEIAAFILVHGMRTGGFTGRRLDQYINGRKVDFIGARRIVNSLDRARLIAGYADSWTRKLAAFLQL